MQPLEEWGYKMEPQHLEGWVHLGEVELQEEQRHWKEPVSLEAGNPDLQLALPRSTGIANRDILICQS